MLFPPKHLVIYQKRLVIAPHPDTAQCLDLAVGKGWVKGNVSRLEHTIGQRAQRKTAGVLLASGGGGDDGAAGVAHMLYPVDVCGLVGWGDVEGGGMGERKSTCAENEGGKTHRNTNVYNLEHNVHTSAYNL